MQRCSCAIARRGVRHCAATPSSLRRRKVLRVRGACLRSRVASVVRFDVAHDLLSCSVQICVCLARTIAFSSHVHFSLPVVSFHSSRSLIFSIRNSVHFSSLHIHYITVLFASFLISALTLSQNLHRRPESMGLSFITPVLCLHGCYVGTAAAARCAQPL